MAGDVPSFSVDNEKLAQIKQALDIENGVDEPPTGVVIELPPQPPVKRKRGRPRKNPLPEGSTTNQETEELSSIAPPAKLTKRDEREVSDRLQSIFIGGTGLASQVKPYLQMTPEEAQAIADPLSSYLVRNADTIPVARQVLENYDLLAITLGVLAYTVRVYRERANELAVNNAESINSQSETLDRLEEFRATSGNGSQQRYVSTVPAPNG